MRIDLQSTMVNLGVLFILGGFGTVAYRMLRMCFRKNTLDSSYLVGLLTALLTCMGLLAGAGLPQRTAVDAPMQVTSPAPYTMVVPPNPTIDWGVAAIIPTKRNISRTRAAQLANAVRNQFRGTKNRAFQIFVFAEAQSAQIFSEYQSRRRGARLRNRDFKVLSRIWPRCLAFVEFNAKRRNVYYPSASPAGWWKR